MGTVQLYSVPVLYPNPRLDFSQSQQYTVLTPLENEIPQMHSHAVVGRIIHVQTAETNYKRNRTVDQFQEHAGFSG